MIPSKRLILKREGNKSVGNAQRRNKSKILNSKIESPNDMQSYKHAKIKKVKNTLLMSQEYVQVLPGQLQVEKSSILK